MTNSDAIEGPASGQDQQTWNTEESFLSSLFTGLNLEIRINILGIN